MFWAGEGGTRPSPYADDGKRLLTTFPLSLSQFYEQDEASGFSPPGQQSMLSAISALSLCCDGWGRRKRKEFSFPSYSVS